jgi:hypothetical protein
MRIARELGDEDEERFQLRNLAYVAETEGYLNWAVNYNRQALHLAFQKKDHTAIHELTLEIARLLINDPEGIAQAVVLLEYAAQSPVLPEVQRMLGEARQQWAQRQRNGRPVIPPERDLMAYAAAAYPGGR